jgi:hypothetical protein
MATLVTAIVATSPAVRGPGATRRHVNRAVRTAQTAAGAAAHRLRPATSAAPAAATSDDDGGDGLAIVALIVGVLGLVVGAAGLLAARRASGRSGAAA